MHMSRESIRVLVLDDDELFCQTLAGSLMRNRDLAFDVVTATNEMEARAAVERATPPFDVFLIDQRLGPERDGIAVLQDLRRLSPESEAIIFTGIDDPDAGMRAYQSGAHRYLIKPFDTRELVWILRSLRKWRDTQYERDWLKVLTEVSEEAQRALSVQEMIGIIVQGGLRLGFERVRLWAVSDGQAELIGVGEIGNTDRGELIGLRIPIEQSTYIQRAFQRREPIFFQGQEHGEGYLERNISRDDFKPAVGEWLMMSLWAGKHCLGVLTLDNASEQRPLRPEQRRLLRLFGRQITAALERARLFALEERKSKELEVLNEIGRHVTSHAALVDLDSLLKEVYTQIGRLMDVSNFMVVLVDRETHKLIFRLHIENGTLKPRYQWHRLTGLVWHLIEKNEPLLLSDGDEQYLRNHNIARLGQRFRSWLGAPLRIGERAEGGIVVWSRRPERVYEADDRRVLMAVADQVAGVIQTALQKEREEQSLQQLVRLNRAGAEMMRLAEENEDWLWHMVLTVATAEYALCFNRAVLLLAEQGGTRLRGRMGIGHFDISLAHQSWREGPRPGFEEYLQRLRARELKTTPVEEFMCRPWVLDLGADAGAFGVALSEGQSVCVPAPQAANLLPAEFIEHFGSTEYAVLPLRAGGKVLGLVVVDNMYNKEPLRDTQLHHLETLLAQAALTWEAFCQRRARDKLIDLNYAVMAELSNRSLKATLTEVCRVAQAVIGADSATIYVLKPGGEPYEFDIQHTTAVGEETDTHLTSVPRAKGISAHILRSGPLIIPDIQRDHAEYDGQRLVDHPFHRGERFRASMGLPLRDRRTGEPLGVIYINHRTPQKYSEQDVHQAESFASLAALAIRNTWAAQRANQNMAALEAERRDREKELNILRRVLTEALAADTEQNKVIRALLDAAHELLDQPDARIGLLLLEWEKPEQAGGKSPEMRGHYFQRKLEGDLTIGVGPEPGNGIIGRALHTGETQLPKDGGDIEWMPRYYNQVSRSDLVVPIKSGAHCIGVFDIEAPEVGTFTTTHARIVERLAAAAGLALDNVRRQRHLRNVLNAAQAVMAPIGLHETLQAVMEAGRDIAPGLSVLTIWYRDPETGRIVLGPYFGVRDEPGLRREEPSEGSVVQIVMHSEQPLWVPIAREDKRLTHPHGRFVSAEGIESTAAFPLRADGEIIGAMFFNYRQHHEFTSEERALFPILAETAAASVRDAARLEATRKERDLVERERARLDAAVRITRAVGTTLGLEETLPKIMDELRRLFPTAIPCVLTYDETAMALDFTQASLKFYEIDDLSYRGVKSVGLDGPGIACRVAREALVSKQVKVENIGDVDDDPSYLQLLTNTRSELCVAAMSGDQLVGVIVIESTQPHAFQDVDEQFIRSVARQVGIAIDRARQSAQLRFVTTVAATTAWAADIAHDINREVGHIRNRAYWLSREHQLSDEGRQYAEEIDASAERLAGTLSSAGQWLTLEPTAIHLDATLRQFVEEFGHKPDISIQIELDLGCADVRVQASRMALRRVIRHLVRNALEAMPAGGRLTVRTHYAGERTVEVTFEDTGLGIRDDLRQSIFHEPKSTKGERRGFGLLFVRSAVEDMGGTVRLLPEGAGQGACFSFTLPVECVPDGAEVTNG
jgi:GAF domain-containing protein/DNA-binding NarL/FixJ family response regulator